eukprot:TRINITY_DN28911_c0_g1_i1.p1 TRINITY_DN28911_c0_g1~~TRINITY_DN28911_c0_g1_i1.p1  ORF type:complete len:152 (+),score=12.57 TRINITY_DN28911_c0_g1_i1:46-501(+)
MKSHAGKRLQHKGKSKTLPLPLSSPKTTRYSCSHGMYCTSEDPNHFINFGHTNVSPSTTILDDVSNSGRDAIGTNSQVIGSLCSYCDAAVIDKNMKYCSSCGKRVVQRHRVDSVFEYTEDEEPSSSSSLDSPQLETIVNFVYKEETSYKTK